MTNTASKTALLTALCALVSACGGGGDAASAPTPAPAPASAPAPAPAPAQVDATNYLNAYWAAYAGETRIIGVAAFLDDSYAFVLSVNDAPGTYPCPGPLGGSVQYTKSGAGPTRTLTFSNCDFGSTLPVVINSGQFSTPDATTMPFTGPNLLLKAATFTLTDVVYTITDPGSAAKNVPERINGSFTFVRSTADLSVTADGGLAFTRPASTGRTDQYTAIHVVTSPGVANLGNVTLTSGAWTLASPRLTTAAPSLTASATATALTVVAPDTSQVVGTAVAGPGVHYVVKASPSATANPDITTANSDPTVQAAIAAILAP